MVADNISSNFDLNHKICKTLDEAIAYGETKCIDDYHILIGKKKGVICVVHHPSTMQCEFCHREKENELFIFI